MELEKEIEKIKENYTLLLKTLQQEEKIKDFSEIKKLSLEKEKMEAILELWEKIQILNKKIEEAQKILKEEKNQELLLLAEKEIQEQEKEKAILLNQLKQKLVFQDPNDPKNVLVEIRAGVGGEEAALFAADLFRMYSRFAEKKGFKIEILEVSRTELSGFAKIVFKVVGKEVFSFLKYESGTHRVQRIPLTESSGRIHTSAVTIAVFPEAEATDFKIDEKDLKIEVFRSSGPGGQHANVTASAVRITHLPTKISVICQSERSQFKNKERALSILRSRLLEMKTKEEEKTKLKMRRIQIGTGERSEKIRTYNFPQNRITDHRINLTLYNLEQIIEGNLEELINRLKEADLQEKIKLKK